MIVTKSLDEVKAFAGRHQPGYLDYLTARGKIEGGNVVLDDAAQDDIREKFPSYGQPGVFNHAMVKAGAPFNPAGYAEFLLAQGKIKGDFLILNNQAQAELNEKFPPNTRAQMFRLSFLDTYFQSKPKGMKEYVLKHGTVVNDFLILTAPAYAKVRKVFSQTVSVSYNISSLKGSAHERPEGYVDQVLALAKIEGDFAILAPDKWKQLMKMFPPQNRVVKYTLAELQEDARRRPPGFADYVLANGKREGDTVILDGALRGDCLHKFPPPIKYLIAHLKEVGARRPEGYVDYVLAHGEIEDDFVIVDADLQKKLREKFPSPFRPLPPEPTLVEMATNFTGAVAGWAKAGFKIVERPVYQMRHAICNACEHWDAQARAGLGKCKICGCTKFKFWLANTKCPDKPPRW